ncbi:MAG: hypothetical protein PSX71_08595 [bacterium]|nr:hypothetical protein [bacterium]
MANEYLDMMQGDAASAGADQGQPKNPYLDMMQQDKRDQDIQLKANLTQSVSTNPDAYAKQRKTADYLGYPVAAVEALPVQTQQQAQVQQVSDATHDTPIARQAYADSDFAKLAHDDSHTLAGIERTLGEWGKEQMQDGMNTALAAPRGILSTIFGAEKQLSLAASTIPMGIDAAASAVTGKPVTAAQDWWFKNTYDELSSAQEFHQGLANNNSAQKFLFAGGSMAGILGAATVTGGESVALGADAGLGDVALNAINHAAKGMVIPSTSAAIQTGKDVYENTGSPISALHAAGMEYLTNTLGGVVPLSAPGGVASRIAQSMASGAIVSELSRQMMNGSLPSDMQQGFDVEGAVINSLTSGILGVGGPHGESSLQHSIRQVYAEASMAGRSADTMQRIGALSELAGKSELRNRDPEAFHELVDKMADNGDLPEVFVSGKKLAEVLNQSGVTDAQFSDMLPEVAKQMHEATETDGDVRISTADYATHISGGPVDEALQPHLKADSDGMTMAEGQAFYQKLETNLKEQADKIVAGHQDLESAKADSQSVHDDILRQLTEVNRFPDSVNKVNAALARDYYTTMADRMGMKPSEMYAAHPLNVESLMKVGRADVLSQGDVSSPLYGVKHSDLSDQIQAEHPGLKLDIMGAEGSNSVSLSRIVVPKESRKTGIGSSVMQRLMQWADANGKTITLSPSDSFGATSTGRLKDFYKRFGFVENKGKNKDFTTSDSMYRKPVSVETLRQSGRINTETPEFKAWFGDSKVVDESGKPLAVYHGTPTSDLSAFDSRRIGTNGRSEGAGFYFTTDKNTADGYGRNGQTLEVHLSLHKPLAYDEKPFSQVKMRKLLSEVAKAEVEGGGGDWRDGFLSNYADTYSKTMDAAVREAALVFDGEESALDQVSGIVGSGVDVDTVNTGLTRALGYDGYVSKGFSGEGRSGGDIWVAMRPEQIKSVFNRGTFDKNDPNILHQRSNDIGQQLKDRMATDHEGVKAEYAKLDGAMGGRLLNTDIARELSPGYRADRTRSADVHEAASGFIKRLYAEKLKEPTPEGMDKTVMFTAGGTGAGKTTGMDAAGKSLGKPEIIYDTNMNTLDSSVEKIEQAFAAGRNVKILYTYRDPVDAFRKGALPRADRMERQDGSGRTVPISEHVRTHVGSSEVMRQLAEKYRDEPRFSMRFIDNSKGKGNASEVFSLADLPEVVNNNLHEQLTEEAHQAHKAGEITAKVRDGFLAKSSRDSNSEPSARSSESVRGSEADGDGAGSHSRSELGRGLRQDAELSELSGRPGSDGSLTQGSSTRGAYSPDTRTISLGKESDLSTFPHELAHHFLEMTNELARGTDAPEAIRSDMDSLLRWFGESGATPEDRLANWNDRTLEEKRDSHEKFAEGFEKYLFEGKAPTVELQPMFARLRSWMLSVYKSLDNMGVQINDEVRGVFDRMIASEEAIKRAEQVRGYEALFKTAEDAGMTEKQFADYQAIGKSATDAAVTDMTAKSLADMKWVSRAKSKFLRGMQREAASQRRETRIEARRQVLSQPVYRAWQFLTAKMGEADGVPSSKAPVSGAMPDPSRDSMFEAIGKIGGLNKKEVVSTWGVDEKHAPTAGAFKKAVWKSEGGKSIDSMAESLMGLGYLPHDEHGKWDIRDFEDKFHSELSGNKEYSVHHDYEANREKLPGEQIDREQIQAGRFDRNSVPADLSARLDSLGMLKHDGIHPDIVAELFGYNSGQELMRDITRLPDPHTAIENLTDQMMLQEHGELTDPQAIERAAEQAIHNEARAKFMATGLKVLTKSPMPANQIAKAAKEAADSAIAAKQVKDLRPLQYTAAEAKANREALKLVAKDPAAAAASQRAALLNNRLARSAADTVTEIQKGMQYLARFSKPSLRAKVDVEYRDQIDALLGRFDLRQNVSEGPARAQVSLDNWVRSQVDAGYSPAFTADMLDQSVKMHYKDLTVEQFRGLVDGIKTIEHIGREQKVVTIDGKRLALESVTGDLIEKMKARGDAFTDSQLVNSPKPGVDPVFSVALDSAEAARRAAAAELLPQQFKANRYDMHEILGPFKGYIFNRVFDANYHKIDMLKGLSDEIRAKVDESLGKEWQKSLLDRVLNKTLMDNHTKPPELRRITRGEMLGIARHVGNESNFEKLTKGMGWNPADVWSFLHDNMTEKDWKATQITWDAAGKYWPEMEAMNRRLGNTAPGKVEARAFSTKFGEVKGGYAPIDYDPMRSRLSNKKAQNAAINPGDSLYDRSYFRSDTTTNGSLNSRVNNYFDFIDLGYHSVERRIHDTVHDLAYREALIDTNKIISNGDFQRQFLRTYGPEQYKSMQKWLGRVANAGNTDENMSEVKAFMSISRHAIVANGIAYRATTIAKHGTSAMLKSLGYFSGGGKKYFLSRFFSILTNHEAEAAGAMEKFAEIRARALQQDRDYRQASASIFEPESLRGMNERFGHAGVAWFDFLSAVPTAWAAYDRAIAEGIPVNRGGTGKPMEEHEAVAYANSIVREAHGSNIESARSMLMSNPDEIVKTLTTLHGFMNNSFGQNVDMMDKLRTPGFSRPEVMSRFLAAFFLPAMAAGWVANEFKDGDPWWDGVIKSMVGEAAGSLPILRDAYHAAEGYSSAGVMPYMSAIGTFAKPIHDAWDAAHGKEVKHPIKDLGNGIGLFIPGGGQLGTSAQYLSDVIHGKENPQGAGEFLKDTLFGAH